MILPLYQFLTFCATPFIARHLERRKRKGKEDPGRLDERIGISSLSRPNGPLVWIHAASVGESIAVLPLMNALLDHYRHLNVLVTTGTVASAQLIENKLPDRALHQYVPVDTPAAVKHFLAHWQPNLALWVESEFWPNLLYKTSEYCPILLVNGRISNHSYARWRRFPGVIRTILAPFERCLMQSTLDAQRLQELGARNVKHIGNLKYDAPALPADTFKLGQLEHTVRHRKVWLASSTHDNEEEMIAAIHTKLKAKHPELLTIIAPRHPARSKEIYEMLEAQNLTVSRRSKQEEILPVTDIYLADTMGELGIFYRLCDIVFIGGSLIPHGGQNPLEASRLGCAVLTGPHMDNFRDISTQLEQAGASIRVENADALADNVDTLFNEPERQAAMIAAGTDIARASGTVLNAYINEIETFLEGVALVKQRDAA